MAKMKIIFQGILIFCSFQAAFGELRVRFFPENPRKGEPMLVLIQSFEKPRVFWGSEEIPVFQKEFFLSLIAIDVGETMHEKLLKVQNSSKTLSFRVALQDYPSRVRKLVIPETKMVYTKPSIKKDQANQKTARFRKTATSEWLAQGHFVLPVRHYDLSLLFFGDLREVHKKKSVSRYYHKGVDFAVPVGTEILASNHGRVVFAGDLFHRGIVVALDHGFGIFSEYLHLEKPLVQAGEWVKKGQVIARSGNSGISTGPHLHWHITVQNRVVNPLFWLFFNLSGTLENPVFASTGF